MGVLFCFCGEVYWVGGRFVFNYISPTAFNIEADSAILLMRQVLPKAGIVKKYLEMVIFAFLEMGSRRNTRTSQILN